MSQTLVELDTGGARHWWSQTLVEPDTVGARNARGFRNARGAVNVGGAGSTVILHFGVVDLYESPNCGT